MPTRYFMGSNKGENLTNTDASFWLELSESTNVQLILLNLCMMEIETVDQ